MTAALWLLLVVALIGGFDTLYYHEWRARLPARGHTVAAELQLHAARDGVYALLFLGLAWWEWHGVWAVMIGLAFASEIVLTMTDFVVERTVRQPLGDVYPGERVTHAAIAIVYGAMLASLVPELVDWWGQPTRLVASQARVPSPVRVLLTLFGAGVVVSGVRDFAASTGVRWAVWPWKPLPGPASDADGSQMPAAPPRG